jgi:hypothetical protein
MTKVYCSISKTVVFKNFVPKQDLKINTFKYLVTKSILKGIKLWL